MTQTLNTIEAIATTTTRRIAKGKATMVAAGLRARRTRVLSQLRETRGKARQPLTAQVEDLDYRITLAEQGLEPVPAPKGRRNQKVAALKAHATRARASLKGTRGNARKEAQARVAEAEAKLAEAQADA